MSRETNVRKHPRQLKSGRTEVKRHTRRITKSQYKDNFERKPIGFQNRDKKRTAKRRLIPRDQKTVTMRIPDGANENSYIRKKTSQMDWEGIDNKPSKLIKPGELTELVQEILGVTDQELMANQMTIAKQINEIENNLRSETIDELKPIDKVPDNKGVSHPSGGFELKEVNAETPRYNKDELIKYIRKQKKKILETPIVSKSETQYIASMMKKIENGRNGKYYHPDGVSVFDNTVELIKTKKRKYIDAALKQDPHGYKVDWDNISKGSRRDQYDKYEDIRRALWRSYYAN